MLNLLQILRYLVFVVFIICNAVITSVAVWNLSIVQTLSGSAFTTAKQIDSFLIFLGAAGLVLIFPILFSELYGKNLVVGQVWFELLWVGVFWLMQLAGAAALTAQGTSQFCSNSQESSLSQSSESPCASTQVLQAFTWIIAILMLGYFTLLSVLTIVKYNDDPTILKCSMRRFPVAQAQNALKSEPASPRFRLSFRSHHHTGNNQHPNQHATGGVAAEHQLPAPAIVAPQPRRHFAALRAAILAHRHSGGDATEDDPAAGHHPQRQTSFNSSVVSPPLDEDEINRPSSYYPETMMQQHQQNMTTVLQEAASLPPAVAVPAPAPASAPVVTTVRQSRMTTYRPTLPPAPTSVPFYNSAVRIAIDGDRDKNNGSTVTPAAIRPLPSVHAQAAQMTVKPAAQAEPPSPPPLGDWPRLDATSRPRTKRKATPVENAERQLQPLTRLNMLLDRSQPTASVSIPQPQPVQTQPQPEPQPRASGSRVYQPQPQPVASSSSTKLPDSGFAAQTWEQTYGRGTDQQPQARTSTGVARQTSVSQSQNQTFGQDEQAQTRRAHERPQRRPSAALPRPPTLEARAPAPVAVVASPPPPPPAPTSAPARKESVRRPLPIPQPLPAPQSQIQTQPQSPQSPPTSAPLARADSSARQLRHLPPPPLNASQVPPEQARTTSATAPPPSWRHKPGGPRRQSNDGDAGSPPPGGLDRFNSIGSSEFAGH